MIYDAHKLCTHTRYRAAGKFGVALVGCVS
jgi:hypothetical protein